MQLRVVHEQGFSKELNKTCVYLYNFLIEKVCEKFFPLIYITLLFHEPAYLIRCLLSTIFFLNVFRLFVAI